MIKHLNKLGAVKVSAIITIGFLAGLLLIWPLIHTAEAREIPSQTFVLPSSTSVTHSANTYIILWQIETGHLVDATDGTFAVGTTWANAAIEDTLIDPHAENLLVWLATLPALDADIHYGFAVFDAATPAGTDVPTMGPFLYDPTTNRVYSDTNPISSRRVRVIQ